MNNSWFTKSLICKTMKPNTLNGLHQAAGPQLPFGNALNSVSRQQPWLSSLPNHDPAVVVAYKAKGRRALLAAQADARRRRLKGVLITGLLIAAFIACGYTMHREQQLLELERNGNVSR